jgi:hypothetical protein
MPNSTQGSVASLWRYPVKSMLGEELSATASRAFTAIAWVSRAARSPYRSAVLAEDREG